jgi:hypothetical protein
VYRGSSKPCLGPAFLFLVKAKIEIKNKKFEKNSFGGFQLLEVRGKKSKDSDIWSFVCSHINRKLINICTSHLVYS